PPPTRSSPLSLHDALPISKPCTKAVLPAPRSPLRPIRIERGPPGEARRRRAPAAIRDASAHVSSSVVAETICSRTSIAVFSPRRDQKSTRLNSSHLGISYA